MKRTKILIDPTIYPEPLQKYIVGKEVYDSSCSRLAEVIYIDGDRGLYLKKAKAGELEKEALMTDYFSKRSLSAKVVEYLTSGGYDWMLTERLDGEDCIFRDYLSEPERLCDTIAVLLRELHEKSADGCPVTDRVGDYVRTFEENRAKGIFDSSYLLPELSHLDADSAYEYAKERVGLLKNEVLIHGDYCLPNVLLKDFKFSGFIDVGNGGIGDRHIDLFWGAWTLNFNLNTDKYRDRFFDAYGRELVDDELIRLISVFECFG